MAPQRQHSVYLRKVADALSVCQLLEECLKLNIENRHLEIRRRLQGRVPFKIEPTEYKDAPMGNLIERFRRVCNNQGLITKLNSFKKERDYVAHRSIAEYMADKKSSPKGHKALMKRLKTMEDFGYQVFDELNAEQDSFVSATRSPSLSDALAERAARIRANKATH